MTTLAQSLIPSQRPASDRDEITIHALGGDVVLSMPSLGRWPEEWRQLLAVEVRAAVEQVATGANGGWI